MLFPRLCPLKSAITPLRFPALKSRGRGCRAAQRPLTLARRWVNPFQSTRFEFWKIPYRVVGRDAVYEIVDLDKFADAKVAAADVRLGRPAGAAEPESAAVFEERCRPLSGGVSPEEPR